MSLFSFVVQDSPWESKPQKVESPIEKWTQSMFFLYTVFQITEDCNMPYITLGKKPIEDAKKPP